MSAAEHEHRAVRSQLAGWTGEGHSQTGVILVECRCGARTTRICGVDMAPWTKPDGYVRPLWHAPQQSEVEQLLDAAHYHY